MRYEPVTFDINTRVNVAAVVRDLVGDTPSPEGVEQIHAQLTEELDMMLETWLLNEHDPAIGEALTESYLAEAMARFMLLCFELIDSTPEHLLPILDGMLESARKRALATGDWSWAALLVTDLIAQVRGKSDW